MHNIIVHTQCLVEGSILAGVLTSSFCDVPECSYSSNATISSLLVAWSSNCSTAPSQWCFIQKHPNIQLPLTLCGLLLGSPKNYLQTLSPQSSHIGSMSRNHQCSNSFTLSMYWFHTTALGSRGFLSLCANLVKPDSVPCTAVL